MFWGIAHWKCLMLLCFVTIQRISHYGKAANITMVFKSATQRQ